MRRVSLRVTSSIGCPLYGWKISLNFKNFLTALLTTLFLKFLGVHAFLIFAPITLINSLYSKQCVFLGYNPNHKGYKCYHIESGRMYISWEVVFSWNYVSLHHYIITHWVLCCPTCSLSSTSPYSSTYSYLSYTSSCSIKYNSITYFFPFIFCRTKCD